MKTNIFFLVFFILFVVIFVQAQQQFVYTIQYAKSYRRDLLDHYMGCKQNSSVIYGTYLHPGGIKDALFVYLNQGVYQTRLSCNNKDNYVKIFGTEQNYQQLLNNDPATVANNVKQVLSRLNPNYIVNWKSSSNLYTEKAKNWLHSFIEKLNSPPGKVYLKIPATFFCYQINGVKYLQNIKTQKLIIEMYGQQPGVYTSYESIFQKDDDKVYEDKHSYSAQCPKYPSYKTLKKNYPENEIYIQKTLQKEQEGYIGPKFLLFLQKGKDIYGKKAFYDSFPQQIIQL